MTAHPPALSEAELWHIRLCDNRAACDSHPPPAHYHHTGPEACYHPPSELAEGLPYRDSAASCWWADTRLEACYGCFPEAQSVVEAQP